MRINVYRDRNGERDLLGYINYDIADKSMFEYDSAYLTHALTCRELGISELLPLDNQPYSENEFSAFFKGLLPEGDVYSRLALHYQVPQSDYLRLLEQMGCETIGALTFISENSDFSEYIPRYEKVTSAQIDNLAKNPILAATLTASSTRLSLAGAQSKIAWYLPHNGVHEDFDSWFVPLGTAPSTHIIKISRKGEEEIALNEYACSLFSAACGIETAEVETIPYIPGAIAVKRYDRAWDNELGLIRLHQEDFCQALGLQPYFKYQPQGIDVSYPSIAVKLLESTSSDPQTDKLEYAKRLIFSFVIGNSDAHLKNFSLLYNRSWTERRLAPLYDVTCIPLTGYSSLMPFDIGEHRKLVDIDEHDIDVLANDLRVGMNEFSNAAMCVIAALETYAPDNCVPVVGSMMDQVLENSQPRIMVLKNFLGL